MQISILKRDWFGRAAIGQDWEQFKKERRREHRENPKLFLKRNLLLVVSFAVGFLLLGLLFGMLARWLS